MIVKVDQRDTSLKQATRIGPSYNIDATMLDISAEVSIKVNIWLPDPYAA